MSGLIDLYLHLSYRIYATLEDEATLMFLVIVKVECIETITENMHFKNRIEYF